MENRTIPAYRLKLVKEANPSYEANYANDPQAVAGIASKYLEGADRE